MSQTILFLGYSKGMGLCYHFVHFAAALHPTAKAAGLRFLFGSTPREQNKGLWNVLRASIPQESIRTLDETPEALANLVETLLQETPSLTVHTQGFEQFRVMARLKRRYGQRLRIVVTIHSFRNGTWKQMPASCFLSQWYRRYADFVVFLSPFAARAFWGSRAMFGAGQAVIIPLGLEEWSDAQMARPDVPVGEPDLRDLLLGQDAFRFVYLAGFSRLKGHRWLIEGLSPALATHSNMSVLLLGDGSTRGDMEALSRSLGVRHQIVFPGRIHRDHVPWILSRCHVGLTSTKSENVGHNCLEPMAAGLPVVGTRVGSAEWLIHDFVTGIGITHGDRRGLGEAAAFLAEHPDAAAAMGRLAQLRVRAIFSWDVVAAAHVRLYERLLARAVTNDKEKAL